MPDNLIRARPPAPQQPCPRCDRGAGGEWRDIGDLYIQHGPQASFWVWMHQDVAGDWIRCNRWQHRYVVGEKPKAPPGGGR